MRLSTFYHFFKWLQAVKSLHIFRGAKIDKFSDMQYFGHNFLKIFQRPL